MEWKGGDRIPIKDIFFVYVLNSTGIPEEVRIFCHDTVKDKNELFSETQLEYFESENVDIIVSDRMIYKEDSVADVRRKITDELSEKDDIYMFTESRVRMAPLWSSIFHRLTTNSTSGEQNASTVSHQKALQQILAWGLNVSGMGHHRLSESYSYNQWMSLVEDMDADDMKDVFVPLGLAATGAIANPYLVIIDPDSSEPFQNLYEKSFLYFSTTSTNIYVCNKKNVMKYARLNEVSLDGYFPKITRHRMDRLLQEQRDEIHRMSWYKQREENEDQEQKNNNNPGTGVEPARFLENFTCTWNHRLAMGVGDAVFPIEAVFKRFHTDAEIPMLTWTRPGGEPLVRYYKKGMSSSSLTRVSQERRHSPRPGLTFYLATHYVTSIHMDADAHVTLHFKKGYISDVQVPESLFVQINLILQSLSLKPLRSSSDNLESKSSSSVVPDTASFQYTLALPSNRKFSSTRKEREFDFLKPFGGVSSMTDRTISVRLSMLEYVPIVDVYFDYICKTQVTTNAFWSPPTSALLQQQQQQEEEETWGGSAPVAATTETWFSRPLKSGFDVYEAPQTKSTSGIAGPVAPSLGALLGGKKWKRGIIPGDGSFLNAMAYFFGHIRDLKEPPNEHEFREILVDSLTLDHFLKYHNGNLPTLFRPKTPLVDHTDNYSSSEIADHYSSSEFAKSLELGDAHQLDLLKESIASFETFKDYLLTNEAVDYTYLWDMVCDLNPNLMPRGLNLVLIQMENGRPQIICPTNAYSSMKPLDEEKETAFLLKEEGNLKQDEENSKEEGNLKQDGRSEKFVPLIPPTGQVTLKNIPPKLRSLMAKCSPQNGLPPEVYPFRPSILAEDMRRILAELPQYEIVEQVTSSATKVVALLIKSIDITQQTLYVPCRPSGLLERVPQVTLAQSRAKLLSYEVTRDRLRGLSYASSGRIPCKPRYKVVQKKDGLQTGLITEANEFVATIETSDVNREDDLEAVDDEAPMSKENDEVLTDSSVTDATEEDEARAFRLESQFYEVYKGLVKLFLTPDKRSAWLKQIQSVSVSYQNKLKYIETEIRELLKLHVHFQVIDASLFKDVYDMMDCRAVNNSAVTTSENKSEEKEKYCLTLQDGSVQTILPKINLNDPRINNETMYALRMADEIIRVRSMRSSLLQETPGLRAPVYEFNLSEDEMVVPLSQLAATVSSSKHSIHRDDNITVWDTADHAASPLDAMDAAEYVQGCIVDSGRVLSAGPLWKKVFPRKTTEVVFSSSCTVAPLLYLAQLHRKSPMPIGSVRQMLWKSYDSLLSDTEKRSILLQLLRAKTPEEVRQRLLQDTEYTLEDVDWWVFCQSLRIPAFMMWKRTTKSATRDGLSSSDIGGNDSPPWIRLYSETAENTAYFFIHKQSHNSFSIVTKPFALTALNTTLLRNEKGQLIMQEI